jgi:hypothetical protein
MNSCKIPKQIPVSVLTQAPNRSFLDQYGSTAAQYSSSKLVSVAKNEGDLERAKSEKGISERLLCTFNLTKCGQLQDLTRTYSSTTKLKKKCINSKATHNY